MSDMGDMYRDWHRHMKERGRQKQKTAQERIKELTQIVGPIDRQSGDSVWVFTFNNTTMQYWPTRGKWYNAQLMRQSMQGGWDAFIGWLRNNMEGAEHHPQQETEPLDAGVKRTIQTRVGIRKTKLIDRNRAITWGTNYPGDDT